MHIILIYSAHKHVVLNVIRVRCNETSDDVDERCEMKEMWIT